MARRGAPRSAGAVQVRHAMADRDVGDAIGAGELERGLEKAGGARISEHCPGLVDHEDRLTTPLALQRGLERAAAQASDDPERIGAIERREIDDDDGAEKIDLGARLAVEHACQLSGDEATQLERDIAPVAMQGLGLLCDHLRRPQIREEQRLDDERDGG